MEQLVLRGEILSSGYLDSIETHMYMSQLISQPGVLGSYLRKRAEEYSSFDLLHCQKEQESSLPL